MTKIRRVEFQPEHLISIKVDPIALKLRRGVDLLQTGINWKKAGKTASMQAVRCDGSVKIVASGGCISMWPGAAELWMAMDLEGTKMPGLPIAVREQVNEWIESLKLDRVQATVSADWGAGIRFLEWLGMKREAIMRKFGPDGIDQMLYARVK
jgi:hypothetical protein